MIQISPIKILLVDDDEDDYFLTSDYLKQIQGVDFRISWAESFQRAVECLLSETFDICFFDFRLGAKTGIDLLKVANQQGIQIPMVMLTGNGYKKVDEEAMRLGAVDYLIKSELDAEKLERCIRYSLERASTIKKLRESEEHYKSIFTQIRQAILLTRPVDGRIIYFNAAVSELLGYSGDELRQMKTPAIFENAEKRQEFARKLNEQGFLDKYETDIFTKNGEKKLCQIDAHKRIDSKGEEYFVGIIHDITAIRKAEKEALTAEKMATAGRLVRTLAHEVRNPLTNINLSIEQMQSVIDDSELSIFLDIIRRNSNRINDLISELLNSYRQSDVTLSKIAAIPMLEECLAQALDRINLKNILLIRRFHANPVLELDIEKIKIAILNIIINAIEAMEAYKGILIIETSEKEGNLMLSIEDNGSGISPEYLGRLFEPYFTSKNNGIGLGLSFTHTIIQSHKGSIDVESEDGIGSKFTIFLPISS